MTQTAQIIDFQYEAAMRAQRPIYLGLMKHQFRFDRESEKKLIAGLLDGAQKKAATRSCGYESKEIDDLLAIYLQ